jgi:hypothetical protein
MGDVSLRSDIPSGNPQKAAVEDTIRVLLRDLSGSWEAEIALSRGAAWWLVSVSRAGDGFQGSVFIEPDDQNPDGVQRLVSASVQHLR